MTGIEVIDSEPTVDASGGVAPPGGPETALNIDEIFEAARQREISLMDSARSLGDRLIRDNAAEEKVKIDDADGSLTLERKRDDGKTEVVTMMDGATGEVFVKKVVSLSGGGVTEVTISGHQQREHLKGEIRITDIDGRQRNGTLGHEQITRYLNNYLSTLEQVVAKRESNHNVDVEAELADTFDSSVDVNPVP